MNIKIQWYIFDTKEKCLSVPKWMMFTKMPFMVNIVRMLSTNDRWDFKSKV